MNPMMKRLPSRRYHRSRLQLGGCCVLLLACFLSGCQTKTAETEKPAAEEKAKAEEGGAEKEKETVPQVATVTATIGTIEKTLPLTGVLAVARDEEATLASPVAGVLDALPIRFGQTVQPGQLIAHLSTRPLLGQLAQAQATIAQSRIQVQQAEANATLQRGQTQSGVLQAQSAVTNAEATLLSAQAVLTGNEATLTNAKQSLSRVQSLLNEGLVARKEVEAAELAVRSAEAQVDAQKQTIAAQQQTIHGLQQAAKAASLAKITDTVKQKDIQIAREQLANAEAALRSLQAQETLYTLRAPIGGTVTSINASVGEAVDTTTKLVTISHLDTLQLQVAVPAASSALVHAGSEVMFAVDAVPGRVFHAAIHTVGKQVDPANNTVMALATIPNGERLFKDDTSVRVGLILGRHRNAVLVPRAAVFYDAESGNTTAHVLTLDKESKVHSVKVQTGISDADRVEIVSGVKAGDTLVTTGGLGLPDGAKVETGEAAKGSEP